MVKAVTFEEFLKAEKENEGKSHDEIFNIAWKTSKQGKEYYRKRNKIFKTFAFGGMTCLGILGFSGLGTIKAFADVQGMQSLSVNNPGLAWKLKEASEFFINSKGILGACVDERLFIDIVKEILNVEELMQLVNAAKGLSFDEMIGIMRNFPVPNVVALLH